MPQQHERKKALPGPMIDEPDGDRKMDDLSRQLTLGQAYDISAYAKTSSTDRLFWALDRFDFDRDTLNEDGRAQRLEASQICALELDRRGAPLRDPTKPVEFPRLMPA